MSRIAIIGAGIAGILPAYYLAKRGHKVTVYEQESYPAMRTSYANGGQVSVSNSEVWTRWSNILKAAKWMFKKDAPLLIRPDLDISKAIWLTKFLYHTAKNDWDKRTIETIKLGLESRALYGDIIREENLQFDQAFNGILHIYKNPKYFAAAKDIQSLYVDAGCEWQIVDRKRIIEIEPALNFCFDIIGGAWTPTDWTGDIHKFCSMLAKVCETKYSVKFCYDHKITNVNNILHDVAVLANGIGAIKLSKQLGDNLDMYPIKGYSITINADDVSTYRAMPSVSLLDDQAKIVTSKLGTRLRIAGTAEFAGENYDIRRDRIDPLLRWVDINFPLISRENYTQWACLRPMTANMMPIVKQSSRKDIYYHTGHGHLGWTLAPATAQQLVKQIEEQHE